MLPGNGDGASGTAGEIPAKAGTARARSPTRICSPATVRHGVCAQAHTLQADIEKQQGEKARLENIKSQVEAFQREKDVLQQRINVIETLQRNRTGGQELMDALANTVVRTDTLWLTTIARKGDSLAITGEAASINAVANFITELKRSGYFDQIEIKESHQDQGEKAVQTFVFELTAQFALPQAKAVAAPAAASTPAPAPNVGRPAAGKG